VAESNLFEDQGQLLSGMGARQQATPNSSLFVTSYEGEPKYISTLNLQGANILMSQPQTAFDSARQAKLFETHKNIHPFKQDILFHAKAAVRTVSGIPQEAAMLTSNLTPSGHGKNTDFWGNPYHNQLNLGYNITDKKVMSELNSKLAVLRSGNLPAAHKGDSILVGGPGTTTLGSQVADLIKQSRGTMTMTSATISTNSEAVTGAIRDKLTRGDTVNLYVGGVSEQDRKSGAASVKALMPFATKNNLKVFNLPPGASSHANVYAFQNGLMLIGSARDSDQAMGGNNVEMLLKVVDKGAGVQLKKILDQHFTESLDPYKMYQASAKLSTDTVFRSDEIWKSVRQVTGLSEQRYRVDPFIPTDVRRGLKNEIGAELARKGITDPSVIAEEYSKRVRGYSQRGVYSYMYSSAYQEVNGRTGRNLVPMGPPEIPYAIRIADEKAMALTQGDKWASHWAVQNYAKVAGDLGVGIDLSEFAQREGRGMAASLILSHVHQYEKSSYLKEVDERSHSEYRPNLAGFQKGFLESGLESIFDGTNSLIMMGAMYTYGMRWVARDLADIQGQFMTAMAHKIDGDLYANKLKANNHAGRWAVRGAAKMLNVMGSFTHGMMAGLSLGSLNTYNETMRAIFPSTVNPMEKTMQSVVSKGGTHADVVAAVNKVWIGAANTVERAIDKTMLEHIGSVLRNFIKKQTPVGLQKAMHNALRGAGAMKGMGAALLMAAKSNVGVRGALGAAAFSIATGITAWNSLYASQSAATQLTTGEQITAQKTIETIFGDQIRVPLTMYRAGYNPTAVSTSVDTMIAASLGAAVGAKIGGPRGALAGGIIGAAGVLAGGLSPGFAYENYIRVPLLNNYEMGTYDFLNHGAYRAGGAVAGFGAGVAYGTLYARRFSTPRHIVSGTVVSTVAGIIGGVVGANLNHVIAGLAGTQWKAHHMEGAEHSWVVLGNKFNQAAGYLMAAKEAKDRYLKKGNPDDMKLWYQLNQKALAYNHMRGDGTAGNMVGIVNQIGHPMLGVLAMGEVIKTDQANRVKTTYFVGIQGPFHVQMGIGLVAPYQKVETRNEHGAIQTQWEYAPDTVAGGLISAAAFPVVGLISAGAILGSAYGWKPTGKLGLAVGVAKYNIAVNPLGLAAKLTSGAWNIISSAAEATRNAGKPMGRAALPRYRVTPGVIGSIGLASAFATAIGMQWAGARAALIAHSGDNIGGRMREMTNVSQDIEANGGRNLTNLAFVSGALVGGASGLGGYRHDTLVKHPGMSKTQMARGMGLAGAYRGAVVAFAMAGLAELASAYGAPTFMNNIWLQVTGFGQKVNKVDGGLSTKMRRANHTTDGFLGSYDVIASQMSANENAPPTGANWWAITLRNISTLPKAIYLGISAPFVGAGGAAGVKFGDQTGDGALSYPTSFTQAQYPGQDFTMSTTTWGSKTIKPDDIAMYMDVLSKSPEWLRTHRHTRNPRVSGTMFYQSGALQDASPSVRMAVTQRLNIHKWALGAWGDEVANYMGIDPVTTKGQMSYLTSKGSGFQMKRFEVKLGSLSNVIKDQFRNIEKYITTKGEYVEVDGVNQAEFQARSEELWTKLQRYRSKLGSPGAATFNAFAKSDSDDMVNMLVVTAGAASLGMYAVRQLFINGSTDKSGLLQRITRSWQGAMTNLATALGGSEALQNQKLGTHIQMVRPLGQPMRWDPVAEAMKVTQQSLVDTLKVSAEPYYLDSRVKLHYVVTGHHYFAPGGVSMVDEMTRRLVNNQVGRFEVAFLQGKIAAGFTNAFDTPLTYNMIEHGLVQNIQLMSQHITDSRTALINLLNHAGGSEAGIMPQFQNYVDRSDALLARANNLLAIHVPGHVEVTDKELLALTRGIAEDVEKLMVEAQDQHGFVRFGLGAEASDVTFKQVHIDAKTMSKSATAWQWTRKILSGAFGADHHKRVAVQLEAERVRAASVQSSRGTSQTFEGARYKRTTGPQARSVAMWTRSLLGGSMGDELHEMTTGELAAKNVGLAAAKGGSSILAILKFGGSSLMIINNLGYMASFPIMTMAATSKYSTKEVREAAAVGMLSMPGVIAVDVLIGRQINAHAIAAGGSSPLFASFIGKQFDRLGGAATMKKLFPWAGSVAGFAESSKIAQAVGWLKVGATDGFVKTEGKHAVANIIRATVGAAAGYAIGGSTTGAVIGGAVGTAALRGAVLQSLRGGIQLGAFVVVGGAADHFFTGGALVKGMGETMEKQRKFQRSEDTWARITSGASSMAAEWMQWGTLIGSAIEPGGGTVVGAVAGAGLGLLAGGFMGLFDGFRGLDDIGSKIAHSIALGTQEYNVKWRVALDRRGARPATGVWDWMGRGISRGSLGMSDIVWQTIFGRSYGTIIAKEMNKNGVEGTSLSLYNQVLKSFSPIWHGNANDYIKNVAIPEQEAMRLGVAGNSMYKLFAGATFNEFKNGIGYDMVQGADLPGRYYANPNGIGLASVTERRIGADFMPSQTFGDPVASAMKTRAMITDTWALGQVLNRENTNVDKLLRPDKVKGGYLDSIASGIGSAWGWSKSTVGGGLSGVGSALGYVANAWKSAVGYWSNGAGPGNGVGGVSDGVAMAHRIITSDFKGLHFSGGGRSAARNAAVGGVVGSRHIENAAGIRDANDYVGSITDMNKAAARINGIRGMSAIVHNAGSGLHLHVQTAAGTQRGVVTHESHEHPHEHEGEHKEVKTPVGSISSSPMGGWNTTVLKSMTSLAKGNTQRFAGYIERAAAKYGVDKNLIALIASQESNFNVQSTSHSGAIGLMQTMPFHWTKSQVASGIARDPLNNIMKGTSIFSGYYNRLSGIKDKVERVKFALASYNAGPGHVDNAMAEARRRGLNPHKYENVVGLLPAQENREYAARVLAWGGGKAPTGTTGKAPTGTTGKNTGGSVQIDIPSKTMMAAIDTTRQNASERVPGIRYAVMQGNVAYTARGEVVDRTEAMSADASDNTQYVSMAKYMQDTTFRMG